jgi:hypothetical protein
VLSASKPISYFVSTKIKPRRAAIAWPFANTASAFCSTSRHCASVARPRATISAGLIDSSSSALVVGVMIGRANF